MLADVHSSGRQQKKTLTLPYAILSTDSPLKLKLTGYRKGRSVHVQQEVRTTMMSGQEVIKTGMWNNK